MQRVASWVRRGSEWAAWGQSPLLLAVRLLLGVQFAQSGWGKLHHLDRVTAFFTELKLPAPAVTAGVVASMELVGGVLFALGLGARVSAVPLVVMMCVAYATSDIDALRNTTPFDTSPLTDAAPFQFLLGFLLVLVFGPGALSADAVIARRFAAGAGAAPKKKKK